MRHPLSASISLVFHLLRQSGSGNSERTVVEGVTITSPPTAHISGIADLLRRDNGTCSFGSCAGDCLSQGAFCCNPGGTLLPPNWICDNGACITSIRGDTGIVDCYDPDNPSGTTQSCIDFKPTTTCASTDRCYTCESDVPYCHWQTWIASNSPTLRWFSCISDKLTDATFLAATITRVVSTSASTSSSSASPTASTSLPSSTSPTSSSATSSTATSASTSATSGAVSGVILGTGAIAGIAVGAGVLLITCVALAWCLFRRRRTDATNRSPMTQPMPAVELAGPTYYENSSPGSAYTEEQWRWQSVEGGIGTPPHQLHPPQELPVQAREAKQILRSRSAEPLPGSR